MAQAIKEFSGIGKGAGFNDFNSTIYTCPANTVAIVLPSIMSIASSNGARTAISWNSSSTAHWATNNGMGNIIINSDPFESMQISHTGKHAVKCATGVNDEAASGTTKIRYSPAFVASGLYNTYYLAMNEPSGSTTSDKPIRAGLVSNNMWSRSSGYPLAPNEFEMGTWVMGPGHKLHIHTGSSGRANYSFLIIEEAM